MNCKKTAEAQQQQPVKKEEPQAKAKAMSKKLKGRAEMIDKDNLKGDESVGTFRWNDSIELINVPAWKDKYKAMLPQLNGGWEVYIAERLED